MSTLTATPSLYERLGGAPRLAAVVDDLYIRILIDGDLAPIFTGVDLAALRRHQQRFLGYLLDGPNEYHGPSLRQIHTGLEITPAQFAAVVGHLAAALAAYGVPTSVSDEVLARVTALREEVVGR